MPSIIPSTMAESPSNRPIDTSCLLDICMRSARMGGAVLKSWMGRFETREKARADLVTDADLASQRAIQTLILQAFPDHQFLGEEGGQTTGDPSSDYRWVVDPLDGTTNYVHQFPNYSVSVAVEHLGQVVAGCVLDPSNGECYTATLGGGAYLGDQRLDVSPVERLSEALVSVSFPAGVQKDSPEVTDFIEVLVRCQALRRMGSAALNLCYLASGKFDAYWATSTKLWDVAAGMLIVSEAGGLFTALDGRPFDPQNPHFLAASTPRLHEELRELLGRGGA